MLGASAGADLSARNVWQGQRLHSVTMNAMPKKPRPLRRKGSAKVIPEAKSSAEDAIVERPDGYYWVGPDGDQEFGPFDSRLAARADRDRFNEEAPVEGETVQEAEREIGIGDWIDAETGDPVEGQSPPHLEEP
jgi:hypothetical protein